MREACTQQRMLLQDGNHFFHVGFCIEQADNVGISPQASLARQRLKYRRIMRVLESNGNGARFHQRIAQLFSVGTGRVQFQLDPWHGKTLLFISSQYGGLRDGRTETVADQESQQAYQ